MSLAEVFIDGIDVTNSAVEGSSTRRLNAPSTGQVKLPMDEAIGGCGSYLKIYFDGTLHFHGRVLLCETAADEDQGYTVYNATDPLEMWKWRPVRQPDADRHGNIGNFSDPTIIDDNVTGPQIIEAMIDGSEGALGDGTGTFPLESEGPLFLVKGSFAVGGSDLTGAPTDWPMTMADLASLLVSTGEVDIVITPIELDVNRNYGQIDVYNGDYGLDLTSSVVFEYGMGAYNVRALRWNCDMTNMANKLWYYLGTRFDDEHWRSSITGTDLGNHWWADCLDKNGNQLFDTLTGSFIHDGVLTCTGDPISQGTSQGDYGVRMDIRVFDARGDIESTLGQCIYRNLWLAESWLRCQPQEMLHLTPTRDTEILTFDIGDIVGVNINAAVNGGLSDYGQRIYEYTISWDVDSVPAIGELVTSAQNEGF